MSKVKGNVVDPLELVDKYGADALRFTLAALTMPGRDVRMDESRVEGYRNFGTKLWNAARFCEMNKCLPVAGFDPKSPKDSKNRWIVGEVAACGQEIDRALCVYRFDEAANAIYAFTWNTFCDWYVEIAKSHLKSENAGLIAETRATAGWVMNQILRLLHPFMPFITEELWELFGDGGRLINADWPYYEGLDDAKAATEANLVIDFVSSARSVRSELNVPWSARIEPIIVGASPESRSVLEANTSFISSTARTTDFKFVEAGTVPPKGSIQFVYREATVALPVGDFIDIAQERARLEKEAAKLEADIAKIDTKLGNEQFLAKAPDAVIEEQKERRAEFVARLESLEAALARLASI